MGYRGQALSLKIFLLLIYLGVVVAENVGDTAMEKMGETEKRKPISQEHLKSDEFRVWIEEQEKKVVQKIMDKISSPEDTSMQHQAKIAVAKYLVNVTFTAMTRRLEVLKSGRKDVFIPETAPTPPSFTVPATATNITMMVAVGIGNETQQTSNITATTQAPPPKHVEVFMFKGNGSKSNDSLPSSSVIISSEFPASSLLVEDVSTTTTNSTNTNETETTTVSSSSSRPIWEEILTFNFSAALTNGNGGGNLLNRLRGNGSEGSGGLLSRLNLTSIRLGGNGGSDGSLFDRLNLTALGGGGEGGNLFERLNLTGLGGGGEGGNLFERLNLTGLGGGGEGGSLFERLNLTGLGGGGEGGSLFARLNLTGLGGGGEGGSLFARLNLTGLGSSGEGGSLFARLNLTGGGTEGGLLSRFNLSSLSAGGMGGAGGLLSRLNFSAMSNGGEGGLPFSIPPPPEGLFNYPTPPPMNDSVRMSQMFLGNQVEKLMGDISNTNLTGIVESTINIATPSTVGVLVNALLNIVLCNPLDRFNGNCGIE